MSRQLHGRNSPHTQPQHPKSCSLRGPTLLEHLSARNRAENVQQCKAEATPRECRALKHTHAAIQQSAPIKCFQKCAPRIIQARQAHLVGTCPAWKRLSDLQHDCWFQDELHKFDVKEAFFDPQTGLLAEDVPVNWAVLACKRGSLHYFCRVDAGSQRGHSMSAVAQGKNAKASLERDRLKRDEKIQGMRLQHLLNCSIDHVQENTQQHRSLTLFFEPLTQWESILFKEFAKDIEGEYLTMQQKDDRRRRSLTRHMKDLVRLGTVTLRSTRSCSSRESTARCMSPSRATTSVFGFSLGGGSHPSRSSCAPPSSTQQEESQQALLAVFQSLVRQVSPPGFAERMHRCTWFRFLHVGGLLGPDEGLVNFTTASAVFDMFAEDTCGGQPTLTLSGWANAIYSTLRSHQSFETERELVNHLFGVVLAQCRASAEVQLQSSLPWQVSLVEEQMCEPEVLQLLHEFRPPLFKLFTQLAIDADSGGNEDDHRDDGYEIDDEVVASSVVANSSRQQVVPTIKFQELIQRLGFLPNIVQTHSLVQHMHRSLRTCDSVGFLYSEFVECLCRISFTYLSTYGNSVQQSASSKHKCFWMLTWLRAKTAEIIPGGNRDAEESIWEERDTCILDTTPFHHFVLGSVLCARSAWPA